MKLIVGLGNPGTKYEKTRHNLGFMVVERLLKDYESVGKTVWTHAVKFKSDIAEFDWNRHSSQSSSGQARILIEKVILCKPKTYMNNSGMAVQLLTSYYKLLTTDVWIVHDDIDLPLGSMKIRLGGASAGHHGVESIIKSLGTDKFVRFRLGIKDQRLETGTRQTGEKHQRLKNVDDFVLGRFVGGEWGKARELIKRGAKSIEMALEDGLDAAMNRFNTK